MPASQPHSLAFVFKGLQPSYKGETHRSVKESARYYFGRCVLTRSLRLFT
jgi:hypothetical protein